MQVGSGVDALVDLRDVAAVACGVECGVNLPARRVSAWVEGCCEIKRRDCRGSTWLLGWVRSHGMTMVRRTRLVRFRLTE